MSHPTAPPGAPGTSDATGPTDLPGDVRHRSDPRLPTYLVAGFGALVAAVALGNAGVAMLGVPFLVLLVLGLRPSDPAAVRGEIRLLKERTVEGDVVEGEIRVDWDGMAEVDVTLAGSRGITPVDPAPTLGWALPYGTGPVTLPFQVRARSWGVHDLGALWVRIRRKDRFTVLERKVAVTPTLRVLPTELRLSRLLKPSEPRAFAGAHLSRTRGHGTDFAELRPYRPGDRLRDLSWGTSARLGTPWVTVHHPERTATVLLVMDTIFSREQRSTEAMARAARAAWAVASAHLRSQDRVGLLAPGRSAAWLMPRSGRRARWMLMEELLAVGRGAEDRSRRRRPRTRVVIPADALVVGVSSLRSQTFVPNLLRYRRSGHATVALVIDTLDLVPEGDGPAEVAARRLWLAQREAERRTLERGGVPTALVTAADGVGPAVLSLRRRMDALLHPTRAAAR